MNESLNWKSGEESQRNKNNQLKSLGTDESDLVIKWEHILISVQRERDGAEIKSLGTDSRDLVFKCGHILIPMQLDMRQCEENT
jgi:hypothetical protein